MTLYCLCHPPPRPGQSYVRVGVGLEADLSLYLDSPRHRLSIEPGGTDGHRQFMTITPARRLQSRPECQRARTTCCAVLPRVAGTCRRRPHDVSTRSRPPWRRWVEQRAPRRATVRAAARHRTGAFSTPGAALTAWRAPHGHPRIIGAGRRAHVPTGGHPPALRSRPAGCSRRSVGGPNGRSAAVSPPPTADGLMNQRRAVVCASDTPQRRWHSALGSCTYLRSEGGHVMLHLLREGSKTGVLGEGPADNQMRHELTPVFAIAMVCDLSLFEW